MPRPWAVRIPAIVVDAWGCGPAAGLGQGLRGVIIDDSRVGLVPFFAAPKMAMDLPSARGPAVGSSGAQIIFRRTSAPSVNAPGSSGSHTVMMR